MSWLMTFKKYEWFLDIIWHDFGQCMYHDSWYSHKRMRVPTEKSVWFVEKMKEEGWWLEDWTVAKGGEVTEEWRTEYKHELLYVM